MGKWCLYRTGTRQFYVTHESESGIRRVRMSQTPESAKLFDSKEAANEFGEGNHLSNFIAIDVDKSEW